MSIMSIFSVGIEVIKELEIEKQLIKKNKMRVGVRESNKEKIEDWRNKINKCVKIESF